MVTSIIRSCVHSGSSDVNLPVENQLCTSYKTDAFLLESLSSFQLVRTLKKYERKPTYIPNIFFI